jgi:putative NADH-flavin reductase
VNLDPILALWLAPSP